MQLTTEIIEFQDNLYIDTVLRKDGFLYFLERIEDAQIIEGEQID